MNRVGVYTRKPARYTFARVDPVHQPGGVVNFVIIKPHLGLEKE